LARCRHMPHLRYWDIAVINITAYTYPLYASYSVAGFWKSLRFSHIDIRLRSVAAMDIAILAVNRHCHWMTLLRPFFRYGFDMLGCHDWHSAMSA
jgi:hypothetical protein